MSVTQSPLIAALVRETAFFLNLSPMAVCPEARSYLLKCELMEERMDFTFTDSHEAN